MAHPVVVLANMKKNAVRACERFLASILARGPLPTPWLTEMAQTSLVRMQRINASTRPKLEILDHELQRVECILGYLLAEQTFPPGEDARVRAAMMALADICSAWPEHVRADEKKIAG